MIVQDEELRNLYKLSSAENLQQLEAGLQYLLTHPNDRKTLDDLRRATHSLKGDSRSVGVATVETLVYCLEDILGKIKRQEIVLSPGLSDRIHQGLDTIGKLVAEAVTGEPSGVDIAIAVSALMEGVLAGGEPEADLMAENTPPVVISPNFIEDEELREIYKIATQERLEALEKGLGYLLNHPEDLSIVDELRRDAHSIKGDSRSAGVQSVETLGRCLEEIILDIRDRRTILTSQLCDRIYQGLDGIRKLVNEAVTGELSGVDPDPLIGELLGAASQSMLGGEESFPNTSFPTNENSDIVLQTSIIDDEELRNLYQVSSQERLQGLAAGLAELQEHPDDRIILDRVRRDAHSLKGDSRSVGVESVETIAHCLEEILLDVQNQRLAFTPELRDRIESGLAAMSKLVTEAVTGEVSGVDINEILNLLLAEAPQSASFEDKSALPSSNNSPIDVEQINTSIVLPQINIIEDEDLRQVYQIASQERLEKIESGLERLQAHPDDIATVELLRRQIHILKGDSASVGINSVARVADSVEQILLNIQEKRQFFTSEFGDRIKIGLDGITKLVKEAVTGVGSGVNLDGIIYQLTGKSGQIHEQEIASIFIEDRELREVYRITSEERLQRIESDLLYLEQNPQDLAILEKLLREAHSLKGDSRSVGAKPIETIIHQVEEIFSRIKRRQMVFNPQLGDLLYQGLDVVGKLVKEAVTGEPSRVNSGWLLNQLMEVVSDLELEKSGVIPVTNEVILPSALKEITSDIPSVPEAYRIDTIRVPTSDLDALVTQTDELTVTRIAIGYTTAAIEEMAILWEEWKNFHRQVKHVDKSHPRENPYQEKLEKLIESLRTSALENTSRLNEITTELNEKIRGLRLLPLATLFQLFPRMVRDLARQQGKEVQLIIEGGETTADKRIIEEIKDSLTHMIRNAVDHGIETRDEREKLGKPPLATIWLRGYQKGNAIIIEVADDGRGLNIENIQQTAIKRKLYTPEELEVMTENQIYNLIFAPGFSTRTFITEISGRGIGLDVVRNNVERLKGNIQIESNLGKGCSFRLEISTSLASLTVLLFEVEGIVHAVPLESVQTTLLVALDEIVMASPAEGIADSKETILWDNRSIPVASLADLLELSNYPAKLDPKFRTNSFLREGGVSSTPTWYDRQPSNSRYCILLEVGDTVSGFFVDRLLDTQEVVLKPQSKILKRVRNVTGTTILPTGDVCTILSPTDLIRTLEKQTISTVALKPREIAKQKPVILLVEDSIFVSTQEKRLLEKAGYEVVVAVDGLEGYNKLTTRKFDAVVSDVEMPRLDGFSLTATIRQNPEYHDLPIILVTTLDSEADQKRGSEAGANAYIIKSKFNQEFLLETLAKLV